MITATVGDTSLTLAQADYDTLNRSGSIAGTVLRSKADLLMIADTKDSVGVDGYGIAVVPISRNVRSCSHLRTTQAGKPGPWLAMGDLHYAVDHGSIYCPQAAGVCQGDALDLPGGRRYVGAVLPLYPGIQRLSLA
jgi:hypothetical protein